MRRITIQGEAGWFADAAPDAVRCRQGVEAVRPPMNGRTIPGAAARAGRIAGRRPDNWASDEVENA